MQELKKIWKFVLFLFELIEELLRAEGKKGNLLVKHGSSQLEEMVSACLGFEFVKEISNSGRNTFDFDFTKH